MKLFWHELECQYFMAFFRAELVREADSFGGQPSVSLLLEQTRVIYEEYLLPRMAFEQSQAARDQNVTLLIKLSEVFSDAGLPRKQAFYLYLAAQRVSSEQDAKPNHSAAVTLFVNLAQEFYGLPLSEVRKQYSLQEWSIAQRDLTYRSQGAKPLEVTFACKEGTLDGAQAKLNYAMAKKRRQNIWPFP